MSAAKPGGEKIASAMAVKSSFFNTTNSCKMNKDENLLRNLSRIRWLGCVGTATRTDKIHAAENVAR